MKQWVLIALALSLAVIPNIAFSKTISVVTKTIPIPCVPYLPFVEQYDWNVQTALNVMFAESSCNPNAVNLNDTHTVKKDTVDKQLWYCVGSFGLFQTSCTRPVYYDPALNVALAFKIYTEQGWQAWKNTCTKKVYCVI
jgi:hypothetical protein